MRIRVRRERKRFIPIILNDFSPGFKALEPLALKKGLRPCKFQDMDPIYFNEVKAVLFDFEGTLVDSQWDRPGAIREAMRELSDLGLPAERVRSEKLGILMREAMKIAPEFETTPGVVRKVIEGIYDRFDEEALDRWALRPQLMNFLKVLSKEGIRMGIVSNAGRVILKRGLERFNLEAFFDVVVSRDEVKELKPSGEGIAWALNILRVSNHHALYIGDTQDDVLASRAAGLRVGILLDGRGPSDELRAAGPDFFINHFGELLTCFGKEVS
jgi:phosphoglycolate phosphatase